MPQSVPGCLGGAGSWRSPLVLVHPNTAGSVSAHMFNDMHKSACTHINRARARAHTHTHTPHTQTHTPTQRARKHAYTQTHMHAYNQRDNKHTHARTYVRPSIHLPSLSTHTHTHTHTRFKAASSDKQHIFRSHNIFLFSKKHSKFSINVKQTSLHKPSI